MRFGTRAVYGLIIVEAEPRRLWAIVNEGRRYRTRLEGSLINCPRAECGIVFPSSLSTIDASGTRSRERFTIYTSTVHYWIISPTRWINILFRNFFISTIVCRVNVTQFMRLSQTERLWVILHCWQCNMTHNRSASSALWDIDIS